MATRASISRASRNPFLLDGECRAERLEILRAPSKPEIACRDEAGIDTGFLLECGEPLPREEREAHVRVGGELHADVAWTYRFTIPQLPRIAGLLAFRDDLVSEL